MLLPKLSAFLYKFRSIISALLLSTIGYFVVFSMVTLPPLGLFLGWHPDTQLIVLPTIEEQYQQIVQPGDVVLAVNGRAVQRGELIFQPPVKSTYELTLQRGNQVLIQQVTVGESQLLQVWELSKGVLSLLIWFLGFLTVRFARPQQTEAVIVGLSFQLIAAGIVSPGPAQLGAPGAWLVGQVLIFYFPLIMLYLSFTPRYAPLNGKAKRLLWGSFTILTILALAAAGEQLLLFPDRSLATLLGVRSQTILTIVTGAGMVTAVAILLARLLKTPKQSYERQQLAILFVFLVLAITPLFFFVIVPVDQTVIFAPFPFIYSFFLLAPAGYFFVLHRQGHLELDAVFSQAVTVATLILAVGMAYATGVYLSETVFRLDLSNITQGIFVLSLSGVAIVGQKPLQKYVDLLVYGRQLPGEESLQDARTRLSANPEPATVTEVVQGITGFLHVRETAVLTQQDAQYTWLAGTTLPFAVTLPAITHAPHLRSQAPDILDGLPQWVELVLPISARGEMLGLLLLARPRNGYFNGRQVRLLQDVADILAFSLLVISLVEAMHSLSQRSLYERELQRQQIATEIHNEPLHALTTLMMQLQAQETETAVAHTAQTIRQVTRDLRRIISGLRPPVLKEAIDWMARQVVREFEENHPDIGVALRLDFSTAQQAPETTKMAFYYILTEALNNVSKHAQATQVEVTVSCAGDQLLMTVKDDGIGPGAATRSLTELLRQHHLGVADMHRWASVGGGSLEIMESGAGGTAVHVQLPAAIPKMSSTV